MLGGQVAAAGAPHAVSEGGAGGRGAAEATEAGVYIYEKYSRCIHYS